MNELEIHSHAPRGATPEELAAYLEKACRGDAALRARVDSLFAREASMKDAFLEEPAATVLMDAGPRLAEQPGETIGNYKLLQQIGEGGFGVVYMADQTAPVRRRVALKIIKLGMDTKQIVARFEAERQALAMMDHPNIARVFDAGSTENGRPYFVMELVKGVPITRFCDEQRLGTRERLALFADVCSAINHAHQKGVIHRDIKPSNVMVTLHGEKAVPKVIDFGIAKATQSPLTDKTLFTRFEQFIGTPAYMSPEQAALSGLDIDTRSDIYALGILLYELLTGRPPFDPQTLMAAGYEEMRRIIREVEPPRPSARLSTVADAERTTIASARQIAPGQLGRLVEPDLDWIVMKAIEKDRTRRYETANAFALDIQHFLADEPVSATPPGAGQMLRKFARRHKTALRVAAVIALLLVAGTVTSTLLAVRAMNAEEEVERQLKAVEKERDATAVAREEAEEIVRVLTNMLESPDPSRRDRNITVVESLDRAAVNAQAALAHQPARLVRVQAALGRAYSMLGDGAKALPLQESVLAWFRKEQGDEHPDTIREMAALAFTLDFMARRPEAMEYYRTVLDWHSRHLPPDNPETNVLKGEIGRSYWFNGLKEEGRQLQVEALARCRVNPGVDDPRTQSLMHWMAVILSEEGRHEEARQLDEEHLALSLKTLGPKHPQTLRARSASAKHVQDAAERRLLREQIIADSTEVFGADHAYTLAMRAELAGTIKDAGDEEEALAMYEDIFARMEKRNTRRHTDTLWVMNSLASMLENSAGMERALQLRADAVQASRDLLGPDHPDTYSIQARQAYTMSKAGRHAEAAALRESILPLLEKTRGPAHSDTSWVRNDLLKQYERERDAGDEALAQQRRLDIVRLRRGELAASEIKHGAHDIGTLHVRHTLAHEISISGQKEKAADYSAETLGIARSLPPSPDNAIFLRYSLWCLSWHSTQLGRTDKARALDAEMVSLHPRLRPVRRTLIAEDASWRWFHPVDGADPEKTAPGFHDEFPRLSFDDSTWTAAAMQGHGFGYGKGFKGVDIVAPPSGVRNAAYFRCRFKTDTPLSHLELRARRDDALMVYLDGKLIVRDNLPDAPDSWRLGALQGINETEIEVINAWPVPGELPAGEHVLAISLHNFNGASSDLRLGNVTLVELAP